MIDALKRNEKIVTAGGIYGTVVSVDAEGDKLVLRIDDDKGVKMTFAKVERRCESWRHLRSGETGKHLDAIWAEPRPAPGQRQLR